MKKTTTSLRLSVLGLLLCLATTLFAQDITVKGVVKDDAGEPIIGATIQVQGSKSSGTITDLDGNFTLNCSSNATLNISYIGFDTQSVQLRGRRAVEISLKPSTKTLGEVVVTAMGIMRKEESLTYATQKVKAEDLMRVQDPNVANSLEGKVSGVVITPSAGGAGGASKIILRGNKSILGNSSPLIVIDGIPINNSIKGQLGSGSITVESGAESNDALSMVNPDDIESMNVLKGANAAALYGSAAANGVIMITTKKGREGKLDVNYTSNVTFDNPLLTPKIQNTYGASTTALTIGTSSWGDKVTSRSSNNLVMSLSNSPTYFPAGSTRNVYLRNYEDDDVDDFFRTGITTNNSISLSGGTEKIVTYFSYANSHAKGMIPSNKYNRNTLSFRQSYNLFNKRIKVDVSANYVNTFYVNRFGGGKSGNPIYNLYTAPRNIDMAYYRDNYSMANGTWLSGSHSIYRQQADGTYRRQNEEVELSGVMQNWAFMSPTQNNPYWLVNMNNHRIKDERFYGFVSASFDIYDGFKFQVRLSMDRSWRNNQDRRYATTMLPSNMDRYGLYHLGNSRSMEYYTDYLLSYNKQIKDFSLSATAGWVGHTVKSEANTTRAEAATYIYRNLDKVPDRVNYFDTAAGSMGITSSSISSNWDKAALFTAQVGWQDKVYLDGSYRQDWYRAFRQFRNRGVKQSYGYYGFGANAIISSLVKLPKVIDYLKYRASYSEVGNSIPNRVYQSMSINPETGVATSSNYANFRNPVPETTKSFETGIESTFFDSRLGFDFTYYNSTINHLYLTYTNSAGNVIPQNSGRVRNQGFEGTVSYDFRFAKDLRWRTSYNLSYNKNKILAMGQNEDGKEFFMSTDVGGVRVMYQKGGAIGDMYVTDYKRDANGHYELTGSGAPQFETEADKKYTVYAGNMNSKWQMGWSNTFTYKDFILTFLINGRIGGKVISLTEAVLDNFGVSQRTADARLAAEREGLVATAYGNVPGIRLDDGSGRVVPIQTYYAAVSSESNPFNYIYNATNFRLRELTFGYTFRNLFGQNKNLSLSFIARNLFFLYKDAPVDPDVSLSTGNGLGAFEMFNMPSSRSFGFNLKVNI